MSSGLFTDLEKTKSDIFGIILLFMGKRMSANSYVTLFVKAINKE